MSLISFIFAHLFRSYQKKLSRTVAVEGAECIQQLTGPQRDRHTDELACTLTEGDSTIANDVGGQCVTVPVKDNAIHTLAESASSVDKSSDNNDDDTTTIPDDPIRDNSIPSSSKSLMEDIEKLGDPVVSIKPLNTEKSSLVVEDNIDVKKEEIADGRKVSFSQEEDKYLKDGVKKYGKRWTDILKYSGYEFHTSRTKDTLRGRYNTLARNRKGKKAVAK